MNIFPFAIWETASECVCMFIIQLRDIQSDFILWKWNDIQDGQITYNITLRHSHVPIVALERQ